MAAGSELLRGLGLLLTATPSHNAFLTVFNFLSWARCSLIFAKGQNTDFKALNTIKLHRISRKSKEILRPNQGNFYLIYGNTGMILPDYFTFCDRKAKSTLSSKFPSCIRYVNRKFSGKQRISLFTNDKNICGKPFGSSFKVMTWWEMVCGNMWRNLLICNNDTKSDTKLIFAIEKSQRKKS